MSAGIGVTWWSFAVVVKTVHLGFEDEEVEEGWLTRHDVVQDEV
jgi:hypothetical protein